MRAPLSLVLSDGTTSRDVTQWTSGLRFRRNAFGGDVDLTCQVLTPRDLFGKPLGPGGTARLYDDRTGELVFSGDLAHPGVTDGPGGQLLDLQALGAASRMQAAKTALAYVHTDTTAYGNDSNTTKGAQVSSAQRPDGTPTLEVAWNKGYGVDGGDLGEQVLRAFQEARLKLGRFRADIDAGAGSAGYKQRLMTGPDIDSMTVADGADANTTAGSLSAYIGSGISAGDDLAAVRAIRTDGGETASKLTWFRFWNLIARQLLKDKFGANITDSAFYTGTDANQVYAHEVIADMLGRGMCPGADPIKATIAAFTYPIDALTWLDGITMGDALTALQDFERDLWWTGYSDTFTAGRWDFSRPRYVISKDDGGITHPGGENTLCNRVEVAWVDRQGKDRTTVVTAYVAELGGDPADGGFDGIIRDAEQVTLNEGTGSDANAQRAGAEALRIANHPPRAGTAVIHRPVVDLWTGFSVTPDQMMPACTVIEQETGDVLQLTDVDFSDADAAATCTLGDPVRTIAQRLARLRRKQRRRH